MVMVPTPSWNPRPFIYLFIFYFGTISPKVGIPPPPHEDIPFGTPRQLHHFNAIEKKEEMPELTLTKDAQAQMYKFLFQIGEKK